MNLVIIPRYNKLANQYYHFPLGAAYVVSALKKDDLPVRVINLNHIEYRDMADVIDFENVGSVIVGGHSGLYGEIKRIIELTRKKSKARVVLCGSIATTLPAQIQEALKPDCIITGHCDEAITKLARMGFPNGVFDGGVINIQELPHPDYDECGAVDYVEMLKSMDHIGLNLQSNPRSLPVLLSNGGEHIAVDKFLDAVDYAVDTFSLTNIEVICSDFVPTEKICNGLTLATHGWSCHMLQKDITEDRIKLAADSGCVCVHMDIENDDHSQLDILRKYNVAAESTMYVGYPYETFESGMEKLRWWVNYGMENGVHIRALRCYPGSNEYTYAKSEGFIRKDIAYLEEGCQPMNITRLDDVLYTNMFKAIEHWIMKKANFANSRYGEGALELSCSFCGMRSIYCGELRNQASTVVCRNCKRVNWVRI